LEEVRMSDGIPKTPGGAENITREFNMAPRVINTRVQLAAMREVKINE
jgi:hypothetical protein